MFVVIRTRLRKIRSLSVLFTQRQNENKTQISRETSDSIQFIMRNGLYYARFFPFIELQRSYLVQIAIISPILTPFLFFSTFSTFSIAESNRLAILRLLYITLTSNPYAMKP